MFWIKKKLILRAAKKCGCDWDGDVLVYHGKLYYVNECNDVVQKQDDVKNMYDHPFTFFERLRLVYRYPVKYTYKHFKWPGGESL